MTNEFHDTDGNPISLDALCIQEPAWAANRVRAELVRVADLEAELVKERERGDALNKRNGRMETELSFLKPESQAKEFMEKAYTEMKASLESISHELSDLEHARKCEHWKTLELVRGHLDDVLGEGHGREFWDEAARKITALTAEQKRLRGRVTALEAGVKELDEEIVRASRDLQSNIDTCLVCRKREQPDRMPCAVCMEEARFLGSLDHLRTKIPKVKANDD